MIKYNILKQGFLYMVLNCVFLNAVHGLSGKYFVQNFLANEYKAGNQNIDFAQNRDMGIFIANNLGVLSYNGNEWGTHTFKSGKKQRSLAFDEKSKRLYVGSQGEFGFFEKDWEYTSLSDKIPILFRDFDEVWDVYINNSKIYFCTFQGIYIYDGNKVSVLRHKDGLGRSFLINNKLYIQSKKGRLLELKNNELSTYYIQNQSREIIAGMLKHEEDFILFYNSGKIELVGQNIDAKKFDELSSNIEGTFVNNVIQLSDNRLVISTQTSGIFMYDIDSNEIENITIEDGLKTNACLRSYQDYSGNLWVGMQNGIALIHINSPLRMINREVNIEGSGYEAYEIEDGTYFTTSNGIYFLKNDSDQSIFLNGTEGPAYGFQTIGGNLYAGHHTGLFQLQGAEAKRLVRSDGMWQVKQLKSNPNFAIGGTYSGLYLFKVNSKTILEPVQKIDGFNESSRFFEEDQSGNIIVGQYYKGLFELNFSNDLKSVSTTKFSNEMMLPIDEQIILTKLDNELYLATDNGLYLIDQSNNKIVDAGYFSEIIGDQAIYLIGQDKQKNIHIVAENLVGFFKKISAQNYSFVPSSLFQFRYYFNNDLLNVSTNINDGIIYSSNEGFIHYHPYLEDRVEKQNPLMITKVYSVTQDSTLFKQQPFDIKPAELIALNIPQKTNNIKFEVESFQYNEVNNNQFRYFLRGFEEEYTDWTISSSKEYTNLSEGNYEFSVQSRNYLGEVVTSDPFPIIIYPPFYRSNLAKIFYVLFGFLTLVMISKYHKRRYIQKAEKAEAKRRHDLERKQQELNDIKLKKEQELQVIKEESMKNQLQHVNNRLAASTMNLVVKNEFIETIKDKLKEVKRKGKNQETKQALEQIVKKIDITLRLQEDWKQFEFHFDQVHSDFLSRLRLEFVDLTPNEQKLCTLLRLNLNTKEIANLMSISQRGVEVARYRLRKKLRLLQRENLSKFILDY
ncbi:MAG: hypothetical protein HKO66_07325 [Saprospiraceae bacterium]|nr:hypothetical protein [Bacteroidia bacterium]NNE15793.1 hypothetical protein [Saprospiraceae bacterium]NNL92024.1 hypothetical protein [Saprospiraceae bacterium]